MRRLLARIRSAPRRPYADSVAVRALIPRHAPAVMAAVLRSLARHACGGLQHRGLTLLDDPEEVKSPWIVWAHDRDDRYVAFRAESAAAYGVSRRNLSQYEFLGELEAYLREHRGASADPEDPPDEALAGVGLDDDELELEEEMEREIDEERALGAEVSSDDALGAEVSSDDALGAEVSSDDALDDDDDDDDDDDEREGE